MGQGVHKREVREGRHIRILIADSHCLIAETIQYYKAIIGLPG